MSKLNVKKGDTVVVISGQDKGKQGKILASFPEKGRVSVQGANMITKHVKPRRQGEAGGRIETEGTIDASNVMYLHKGKATRIGFEMKDGKKVRVAKSTGEVID